MKTIYKKILPFILSAEILILSFFSCSITVHAVDFMPHDIIEAVEYGIENNDWEPFYRFLYEVPGPLLYLVSQMGAVVTADFQTWVDNNKKFESLIDTVPAKMEDDEIVFTKEFMAQLKVLLDEYAKTEQTKEENGGFYLMPTINYEDVPMSTFKNSYMYYTFRNIVREKGVLPVRLRTGDAWFVDPFSDPEHPILLVGNASSLNNYLNNPEIRVTATFFCVNDWKTEKFPMMLFEETEKIHASCAEAVQFNTGDAGYLDGAGLNKIDTYNYTIYSATGERVRVFVSAYAAQNYSVGSRKIYFTENYYNYEPEDLTVAVDDLQKSVDDLQKIIDELLKKINDDTSEKEIEELLRLILEELQKNPGTGSGSISGGGDVTVSVDLKETNNWLYKIYNRLGEILDRIEEGILTKLDEISEILEKIKNWTAADTVIDGADAVADWLDLIHDVLTDGAGSAVDALSSALQDSTDLMKQKFPFSIPWDILFFVSVLSAEPETPQFSIPFNFEFPALDLSVDYQMELDFTPLQWLSDLSRLLLSMTYAAGLMKKTVDIVSAHKEG